MASADELQAMDGDIKDVVKASPPDFEKESPDLAHSECGTDIVIQEAAP